MYNRIHKSLSYVEKSLFKELTEFSWGIETSFEMANPLNTLKDQQSENYNMYVPLYNAFGRMKMLDSSFTLNKFAMRYCIIDEDQNELKFTQLKLEVEINPRFLPDNFEEDSIKSVSRIKREESNIVDIIIKASYLPDVIESTKSNFGDSQRVTNKTIKTMNPLWTYDSVENCINNQLVFRVSGEMDLLFEKEFNEEFENIICKSETKYIKLPEYYEKIMSNNCLKAISELSLLLEDLPFRIHYTFLCLMSTKVIQFLDYSFQEIKELIVCIKQICSDDPKHIVSVDKSLALMKPKRFDRSRTLTEKFLEELEVMKICKENRKYNKEMISIRRVIVTQSCIQFKLPTQNMPNRVIRKYK